LNAFGRILKQIAVQPGLAENYPNNFDIAINGCRGELIRQLVPVVGNSRFGDASQFTKSVSA
jgi:hypothetical protein